MSHYQKPKRIKITLWIMLIGIALASLIGVIVPYLPTASDDINSMTQDITTGEVESSQPTLDPNSVLNQFQSGDTILSGDTTTGSN